jgi:hypothetical protein
MAIHCSANATEAIGRNSASYRRLNTGRPIEWQAHQSPDRVRRNESRMWTPRPLRVDRFASVEETDDANTRQTQNGDEQPFRSQLSARIRSESGHRRFSSARADIRCIASTIQQGSRSRDRRRFSFGDRGNTGRCVLRGPRCDARPVSIAWNDDRPRHFRGPTGDRRVGARRARRPWSTRRWRAGVGRTSSNPSALRNYAAHPPSTFGAVDSLGSSRGPETEVS